MADLMQKTKKELITMLQDKELAVQSLQGELGKARSENHQIRNEVDRIRQEFENLKCQFDSQKMEHEALEQRTRENSHKSDIAYELFKSFVETDSRKTLLIDTTYAVCYINRSAAAHLQLPEPGVITGCRLFDFFAYKDALKVKKKIDAAFFSGEKEKIKEVTFVNPKGGKMQIDLKMSRVRYRDKPSIKMTIK
jgi:hypothetical protein